MIKERRICAKKGCETELCTYNKNRFCYICQNGGRESIFFEPKPYCRQSRSGGRITRGCIITR